MAWGLESGHEFNVAWATHFPDRKATLAYLDVFYRGSWVYREPYVIVDGARCYLPHPVGPNDMRVAPAHVMLIYLIDRLTGSPRDFRGYFRRAGLQIANVPWPKI
jgi:hypothetical protein